MEAAREWAWLNDACAVGELDGDEWSPKIDSRLGFAVAEFGDWPVPPRRRVEIQRGEIELNESESDWCDVDLAN